MLEGSGPRHEDGHAEQPRDRRRAVWPCSRIRLGLRLQGLQLQGLQGRQVLQQADVLLDPAGGRQRGQVHGPGAGPAARSLWPRRAPRL